MKGIVIELEKEALNEQASVESLLRKAYLVARKLKLEEFEEWINNEQNGYKGNAPDYRMINGEYKGLGIHTAVGFRLYYLLNWEKLHQEFR